MALGAYQLLGDDAAVEGEAEATIGFSAYFGFGLVLLANSSDSVSVMTPLLADLKPGFVLACFVAAVGVAIAMGWLAGALARHPAARVHLEHVSKWMLPFILIAIGALIFADLPSDLFVG
jgi:cadmium resistance protein CadD (predicted permease)